MTNSGAPLTPEQLQQRVNQKLHEFIAEFINRRFNTRDAVSAALNKLADFTRAANVPVEIRVGAAEFETMVQMVDKTIDQFRTEQEKGAIAVGGGVYADVVDDEEYAERMRRAGLLP